MGKSNKTNSAKGTKANNKHFYFIGIGVLVVFIVIASFLIKGISQGNPNLTGNTKATNTATSGDNLMIVKSDITVTAKFYPYKAGDTKMEIIALKASDGTIRTAFNTCQVCYSSGRGYYKVEGDTLVCQNCGNVFNFDQVEQVKGGCNPVPILEENKTDDGTKLTISKEYLEQAKQIFANWKKQ